MQRDNGLTPEVPTKGDSGGDLPVEQRPVALQGDTSRLKSPCESLVAAAQGCYVQAELAVEWGDLVF
jgi:hypothetical protein